MRVIKRALTDAATTESGRAAEVALASPQEPPSTEQSASKSPISNSWAHSTGPDPSTGSKYGSPLKRKAIFKLDVLSMQPKSNP